MSAFIYLVAKIIEKIKSWVRKRSNLDCFVNLTLDEEGIDPGVFSEVIFNP